MHFFLEDSEEDEEEEEQEDDPDQDDPSDEQETADDENDSGIKALIFKKKVSIMHILLLPRGRQCFRLGVQEKDGRENR